MRSYISILLFLLLTIKLLAQKKIVLDSLPKFQLEEKEIQKEIEKYKNTQSRLYNNTRVGSYDSAYFYFTSAINNDPIYKTQIVVFERQYTVKRGINILTNINGKLDVINYDLYGDSTKAEQFLSLLTTLCNQKLFFALIVEPPFQVLLDTDRLRVKNLGFKELSNLNNGETYVSYNQRGFINEFISGISLDLVFSNELSNIVEPQKYIDENSKDKSRFNAHAGGEIDGFIYTNSIDALDLSYSKGFRQFELDIVQTSDSVYVASHDWGHWAFQTGFLGSLPPSLAEYNSYLIYGKYRPVDMHAINSWFATHPDAILVSDKVNEPTRFANQFVDKSRLMMELFTLDAVKEGLKCGILSAMSSESVINEIDGNINLLDSLGVKHIAVSRNRILGNEDWFDDVKAKGIKSFVYNVGDSTTEVTNSMRYIFGIYADIWNNLKK